MNHLHHVYAAFTYIQYVPSYTFGFTTIEDKLLTEMMATMMMTLTGGEGGGYVFV